MQQLEIGDPYNLIWVGNICKLEEAHSV